MENKIKYAYSDRRIKRDKQKGVERKEVIKNDNNSYKE